MKRYGIITKKYDRKIKLIIRFIMNVISYADFEKVDIRVGTIIEVNNFPQARKPAYQLLIDFGPEIGTRRSSAQITQHYGKNDLLGKQVLGVVNFPEKQIGPFFSQVLTLGLPDENGNVVLVAPTKSVPNGKKLF
jgi:tRNA-binding protein